MELQHAKAMKQPRILIVQDNPEIIGVLTAVIESHSFQTLTARSGAAALARLA